MLPLALAAHRAEHQVVVATGADLAEQVVRRTGQPVLWCTGLGIAAAGLHPEVMATAISGLRE